MRQIMDTIHFPIGAGGLTFSVEMRSGEGAPLGPLLSVKAQQNGQLLNNIQMFTDSESLYALGKFFTREAEKFEKMEKEKEVIHHPFHSSHVPPYISFDE